MPKRAMPGRPILVTGSHRSGTTWTGKILSSSPSVGLIMEPFAPTSNRPGVFSGEARYAFSYLRPEDGTDLRAPVKSMLNFEYSIPDALGSIRGVRDLGRMVRDAATWRAYRTNRVRPLIKDPSALLLTKWLAANFDVIPVVLIRHPAAFISSLLTLGWRFSFDELLSQSTLMEDHLAEFEEEMVSQTRRTVDAVDEGILLWRVLYKYVADLRNEFPSWLFVRHKDLSLDPMQEFASLCESLELEFDAGIRRAIEVYCDPSNPADSTSPDIGPHKDQSLKRDTLANITNWKNRLSVEDIKRIRRGVEDVASQFYSDDDW